MNKKDKKMTKKQLSMLIKEYKIKVKAFQLIEKYANKNKKQNVN